MNSTTTVSFPGLGIEEFTLDRIAFSIFSKPVYWYGVIILVGMIVAFVHAYLRSRQEGTKTDDLLDIGIWTVISGVIGARFFYVLFDYFDRPKNYTSFQDFIAVWNGGLAIYGGVIFGALAIFFVTRYKKLNTLKVMDSIAPGVMIAQAIGRWGNFFNGEAHGGVVSDNSPLYFIRMGLLENGRMQYFHPTFLYESIWNIVGFILITIFYRKKKFNGQIVLAYFAWYGFGRMFIEALRTDSLWLIPGVIRVSQLIGALCFVGGVGLTVLCLVAQKKGKWSRWLTVQWAQPVPAAGAVAAEPCGETSAPTETATEEKNAEAIQPNESPAPDAPEGENPNSEKKGE